MKVVTPYRPFAPESASHRQLGPFDWTAAVGMLRASVLASCRCETYALTDLTTGRLGPAHRYPTEEPRLMLWLLEVALAYLGSADFDQDTILVSPDALVLADLSGWFKADLGVMVRTGEKYIDKPILNGLQCWRVEARDRLVDFYARALEIARGSAPGLLRWGADTAPLVELLSPIRSGLSQRAGLSVHGFEAVHHFRTVTTANAASLARLSSLTAPPVADFKGQRKRLMASYWDAWRRRAA